MSEEQRKLYQIKTTNQLLMEFIFINGMEEDWHNFLESHIERLSKQIKQKLSK
jgi:hypothetical protein